jgi:hypothetical protein
MINTVKGIHDGKLNEWYGQPSAVLVALSNHLSSLPVRPYPGNLLTPFERDGGSLNIKCLLFKYCNINPFQLLGETVLHQYPKTFHLS